MRAPERDYKLPDAGEVVRCRVPGALSLEVCLGEVPVVELEPNTGTETRSDSQVQVENLAIAKRLLELCTIEPHLVPRMPADCAEGDTSQDEITMGDFWWLFWKLWDDSGMAKIRQRLDPTAAGSTYTTPSADDTAAGRSTSSSQEPQ